MLMENYRSVTVSSAFSKIFEYSFLKRLFLHSERNNILTNKQHGFRENKFTATATLSFYEGLVRFIEANECPVKVMR